MSWPGVPAVTVRGAPFRATVEIARETRRRWRVEVYLRVRTGRPGSVLFSSVVELPKPGVPRRATVLRLARYNLHRALCHEVDECLHVDGVRVGGAHGRRRRA